MGKSITKDEVLEKLVGVVTEGAVGIVKDETMMLEITKVMT